MSTLRLLHVADTHLDAVFPAQGAAARLRRANQLVDRFRAAVAENAGFSGGRPADLCIHAGDVFDSPRPTAHALAGASGPMLSLAAQGMPVFIVPGNHDRAAVSHSILLTHPRIHLFTQPGSALVNVRGLRVRIIGIPYQRTAQEFLAALADTHKQHVAADVVILACHQAFRGAVCGAHDFRFTRGDDVVDPADLPPEISYVAAGHIHRYQTLTGGRDGSCQIVYAGSTDRMSFAERDEPKGCVFAAWEGDRVSHEFRAHPVRAMQIVPLDVTGLDGGGLRRRLDDTIMALPHEAIAELRLTGETTPDVVRGLRLIPHARRLRPDIDLRAAFQAVRFVPDRMVRRAAENEPPNGADGADAGPVRRRHGALSTAPVVSLEERGRVSAFDGVCDPVIPIGRVPVGAVAGLPELAATYAMWSSDGRLLYIGKARRLRTRIRSHLRLKGPSNFFTGWAREVAEIEFRPAESELEAALVETVRIQALRPPFNRQYRGWEEGCYVVSSGGPFGELVVAPDAIPAAEHFGPFGRRIGAQLTLDAVNAMFGCAQCPAGNGRRASKGVMHRPAPLLGGVGALCDLYYAKRCSGPCAGKVSSIDYALRVAGRDALLRGEDDGVLCELERALGIEPGQNENAAADDAASEDGEERAEADSAPVTGSKQRGRRLPVKSDAEWRDPARMLADVTGWVALARVAFERAKRLRAARGLMNCDVWLPGNGAERMVMRTAGEVATFARGSPTRADMKCFDVSVFPRLGERERAFIPKALVEPLLLVAANLAPRAAETSASSLDADRC